MSPANFLDVLQLRTRIVVKAREVCGLGSTGPEERQRTYEDFLFPHPEDERSAEAMADAMSSCGLVARSLLYLALVDAWELGAPYSKNVGKVITWIIAIARRMGAWVDFDTTPLEKAPDMADGDVPIIGREGDPAFGGPTHVLVLLEGGEKGYGILEKTVRFERRGAALWCRTVNADGTLSAGRRVQGFINAAWLRRTDE